MQHPPRRHFLLRAAAPLALFAGLAASLASAHEGAVLDLEKLEARIDAQTAATVKDRKLHAAYVKLGRTLGRPSRGRLSTDVAKVEAAAKAIAGPLVADGAMFGLVAAASDTADAALGDVPDAVSIAAGRLAKQADRNRVAKTALAAWELHRQGRAARDPADERAAVGLYRRAAVKYEQAITLATSLGRRKARALPPTFAAQPSTVYTVAGTGEGGFNGDGRPARRTSLYFVDECRFGPDGLLYVLDWNNHMVRCVDPDGTVRRICGAGTPGDSEGAALDTQLNHPSAVAFDGSGRVLIAAWHNHKVKVWDPNAAGGPAVYTIAGGMQGSGGDGGLATDANFTLVPAICRLPDGDLLAIDAANQVIRRIDLSHPVQATNVAGVTVPTATITHFAGTQGVAGRGGDNGPAATATLAFSKSQNAEPDGRMELDPTGRWLYVVSGASNCVRRIDMQDPQFTITTFAGTGTAGYTGDDGPAASATLDGPADIAVAADGTVFISDSNNHAIRRVDPAGTITTYAGGGAFGYAGDGGPVGGAKFHRPAGLEIDAHGNLYVCDRYNSVIRVLTSAAPGGLAIPQDPYVLPLPSNGAPPEPGTSRTIDTYVGTSTLGFNGDRRPALDTDLYWPQDCAVDSHGILWFCDWNNHRIRRVEGDGTVTTVVGSGQLGDTTGDAPTVRLNHPTDLTFHPVTGELWIAGWHTDKVLRLDASTNRIVYMAGSYRGYESDDEGGPSREAVLNLPSSLKFDAAGNWYLCDEGNRRIRFVDAAKDQFRTLAGNGTTSPVGDNGPATGAALSFPIGQAAQPGGRVALSPDERWLYVAETGAARVRRIDLLPPYTITTFAGTGVPGNAGDGGPAVDALLQTPVDVDCDAAGNVYVVDQDAHVVRRVDAMTGTITTFVGTGEEGYSGDRGPASAARLRSPGGIYVQRATGRVYVADTYNGVIRVVWE